MVNKRASEAPSSNRDDAPVVAPSRAALAAAIAEEEARGRLLEAEQAEVKVRIDALRAKLAALEEPPTSRAANRGPIATPPRSSAEKVKLFRQLFRGRDDLYPTRFVSKKTGKAGYRAIGYARDEAPLGYAEPKDDSIVEYDDDVIRTLDHESATDRSDDFPEWLL